MEYWTPASALVIAAHPDDIEFSCAGTVARWIAEGARVSYDAESGPKGPAAVNVKVA
jgi:hypothetical protein